MEQIFDWFTIISDCVIACAILFLPIFAVKWKKKNGLLPEPKKEDGYIMYQPRRQFWIGTLGALLSVIVSMASFLAMDWRSGLTIFFVFGGIGLLGIYLAVYCAFWSVVVEGDLLTVQMPLRPAKKIRLWEISRVKEKKFGIIAYSDEKKLFMVDNTASNYDLLYGQLFEAGKIERFQKKESITVTVARGDIARITLGALFFDGLLVAAIVFKEDIGLVYWMILLFFAVIFTGYLIASLRWRVTVSFGTVGVRKAFSREKTYSIREITMVYKKKDRIILFAGERKVEEVMSDRENYTYLLNRLENEKTILLVEE